MGAVDHVPSCHSCTSVTSVDSSAGSPPATPTVRPSTPAAAPEVGVGSIGPGCQVDAAGSRQSVRLLVAGSRPPVTQTDEPDTYALRWLRGCGRDGRSV